MKIAYLAASSDISGGQRVIFQQAEGLAAQGHDVTLVCSEPPPTWFPIRRANWEMMPFAQSTALRQAHIRVATYWTTVAPAMQSCHVPVFHLCQGYEADFSFNQPEKKAIEAAYALPTIKLAISPHVTNRLISVGHINTHFVGQAFNPKEFPSPNDRKFNRYFPIILLPGIFEADVKGIREALRGLWFLRREGTPFKLHRVSTWPQSMEEKKILTADAYHTKILPVEMARRYRDADLFIGPSHPEEGFGLHVLEALSSGLPALLSNTAGHRHIAADAAEYFHAKDPQAVFQKLKALLPNRARLQTLSKMGPGQANRFRTEDVVRKLISLFACSLEPNAKS